MRSTAVVKVPKRQNIWITKKTGERKDGDGVGEDNRTENKARA